MIKMTVTGNTSNMDRFLSRMIKGDLYSGLDGLAQKGVEALRSATPRESGLTADSWTYEIIKKSGTVTIWWSNTNQNNGFNVAIGLQYGHATGNGGWIQGYDYINPALRPIFDKIAEDVWREVKKA